LQKKKKSSLYTHIHFIFKVLHEASTHLDIHSRRITVCLHCPLLTTILHYIHIHTLHLQLTMDRCSHRRRSISLSYFYDRIGTLILIPDFLRSSEETHTDTLQRPFAHINLSYIIPFVSIIINFPQNSLSFSSSFYYFSMKLLFLPRVFFPFITSTVNCEPFLQNYKSYRTS